MAKRQYVKPSSFSPAGRGTYKRAYKKYDKSRSYDPPGQTVRDRKKTFKQQKTPVFGKTKAEKVQERYDRAPPIGDWVQSAWSGRPDKHGKRSGGVKKYGPKLMKNYQSPSRRHAHGYTFAKQEQGRGFSGMMERVSNIDWSDNFKTDPVKTKFNELDWSDKRKRRAVKRRRMAGRPSKHGRRKRKGNKRRKHLDKYGSGWNLKL